MNVRRWKIIGLASVLWLSVSSLPAAVITWDAVDGTDSVLDISTNGTQVAGFNCGGSGNKTVNGEAFTATNTAPLGTAGVGMLIGTVAGHTSADPIWQMLNSISYGGGDGLTTVQLTGLEAGKEYEVQVFFADRRSTSSGRTMQFGDGNGNTVNVLGGTNAGNVMGQNVIGTFTADGTTQALTMDPLGFGNSHINAYQVRELVPEPATMCLLASGGIALLARRRKRA